MSHDQDRRRVIWQGEGPTLSPARRKRLLKTDGPAPAAGYTIEDLECFQDLLSGLDSHITLPKALQGDDR
ncbi:hypothetical protein A4R35_09850 [Thermogemmatispora tikiterensis]|uniref:Uncharacterized protein n=2 Tax=Thermogemmatispora tikiterensis TaxID=1825093 RepID=A0A328VFW5_9CHLR|nr:hypothetical protein A4R35_09850 [Thermogemmatispora tikiterensis]